MNKQNVPLHGHRTFIILSQSKQKICSIYCQYFAPFKPFFCVAISPSNTQTRGFCTNICKNFKYDLEIFTAFGNIFCILCEQHNDKSRRKHIPRVILQVTTRFHDTLCSPSTILKIFQIERKLIQMTLKITGRKKI